MSHLQRSSSARSPSRGISTACIVAVAALLTLPCPGAEPVTTPLTAPSARSFGTLPDGSRASLFTLAVPGGWQATITDYGGIVTSLLVPRPHGEPIDVVLGFDSLDGYLAGHPYFGAICGRVGNRIAGGSFSLDGKTFALAKNNGPNHLHGGLVGFDKKLWKASPRLSAKGPALELELVSPAGDEGYPGSLTTRVTYTLTPDGELWVEMEATTDAPTVVNLVHHSYWNLAGQASGSIADHTLSAHASRYLPLDGGGIPTGPLVAVAGTPFDFQAAPVPLGKAIAALTPSPEGAEQGGVDHCLVIDGWQPDGALRPAVTLTDPGSGRSLEILTDQPGIQVYTGNYLDGSLTGKAAAVYRQHAAVCLETQYFPDAINHETWHSAWPSGRLDPGQTYRHVMVHRFGTGR